MECILMEKKGNQKFLENLEQKNSIEKIFMLVQNFDLCLASQFSTLSQIKKCRTILGILRDFFFNFPKIFPSIQCLNMIHVSNIYGKEV